MRRCAVAVLLLSAVSGASGDDEAECNLTHVNRGDLSETVHLFTRCLTRNVVPDDFCLSCAAEMQNFNRTYCGLSKACRDSVAVKTFRDNLIGDQSLWNMAGCSNCQGPDNVAYEREYNSSIIEFLECTRKFEGETSCNNCSAEYSHFIDLYGAAPDGCNTMLDVTDGYRRVMTAWSHCIKVKVDTAGVGSILGVCYALIGGFYASAWVYGQWRERRASARGRVEQEGTPLLGPSINDAGAGGAVTPAPTREGIRLRLAPKLPDEDEDAVDASMEAADAELGN